MSWRHKPTLYPLHHSRSGSFKWSKGSHLGHVADGEHQDDDGHDAEGPLLLVSGRNGFVHRDAGDDQDGDRNQDHDDGRAHQAVELDVGRVPSEVGVSQGHLEAGLTG